MALLDESPGEWSIIVCGRLKCDAAWSTEGFKEGAETVEIITIVGDSKRLSAPGRMLHQNVVTHFGDIDCYEITRFIAGSLARLVFDKPNLPLWAGYDYFGSTMGRR